MEEGGGGREEEEEKKRRREEERREMRHFRVTTPCIYLRSWQLEGAKMSSKTLHEKVEKREAGC
jgi:hypothetical protein